MHQLGRRAGLHVFRVFHRKMDPGLPRIPVQGMEIRPLTEAELIARCSDPELDLSERMVRQAFERKGVCVGALAGSELAGYVWFAYDIAPHVDGVWVKVPAQAVYRYKAYVRPKYRGKGIAPALYRFADGLFRDTGRDYVVNCIATHNFSSIAASKTSGARALGYLGYWQPGRRFFSFHSPAVQRFGLRFYFHR